MNDEAAPTAISSTRKNGKAASCEPCRKRKIACDHEQPVCGRCKRRGLRNQCFYHPAPLTRAGNRDSLADDLRLRAETAASRYGQITISPPGAAARSLDDIHSVRSARARPDAESNADSYEARYSAVHRVVAHLHHIPLLRELIEGHFAKTAAEILPGALILPAVRDLYDRWTQANDTDALLRTITEEVVYSTSSSIDARALVLPADFCRFHHGKNLRLEVLAIIYAIAARTSLYSLMHDADDRGDFMRDMLQGSTDGLRLARDMAPEVSDVLVWLEHSAFLLSVALYGYTAVSSWNQLNELISDMLALDMHREASYTHLAFYLAQYRKRIFAATYYHDKMMATLLDRPPRLLRRYMDCSMPLDLDDADVLTEMPFGSADPLQKVTPEGWSIEPRFSGSSWARLRFQVGLCSEEILEISFQPLTPESRIKLKSVSTQSHTYETALPTHLRYTPECWDLGLPDAISFMLTTTYLAHRHLDFQIFRRFARDDVEAVSALMQASMDMITTVTHVGALRTRASFLAHDFESLVLAFGIPSAAALATALETSTSAQLPAHIARAKVIRTLSVFVSMLESLQGLTSKKQSLCVESADLISRVLDRVLEGPSGPSAVGGVRGVDNGVESAAVGTALPPEQTIGPAGVGGAGFASAADWGALGAGSGVGPPLFENEIFQLEQWVNNVGWADIENDWMNV